MHRLALVIALALVWACKKPELTGSAGALRFENAKADFGSVFADGREHTLTVNVVNDGHSTLQVSWSAPGAPFAVEGPESLPSGATEVTVHLTPTAPGRYSLSSTVTADTSNFAQLNLEAAVKPIPVCAPESNCNDAHFDLDLQRCVQTVKPDGVACDLENRCFTQATCQQGRCIGTEVVCNDNDACTVDVCNALTGCEFLPAPPCPGDGVCQVGVCDPKTGCGFAQAADGTTCGSLQTCTAAQVCVGGACVVRDPPEGYVCAEASPCQGEGRCVDDVCVRAAPTQLTPDWHLVTADSGVPDAGIGPKWQHDFVMEPSGAMTLTSFFFSPANIRANTPQAVQTPEGSLRRCIVWNEKLVCADYPSNPNGRVTAIDPSTGHTVWSFDVRAERPDFLALTTQIFLARLVVQSSDRLAVVFEGYPVTTPPGSTTALCRRYFLIVLDGNGHLVMGQALTDPLLAVCNHPHPYGVASDAVGNLFIAFSPTRSAMAPLKPDNPTMIMSFTRDGIFRWKLTEPTMTGGELAIAHGVLYPENSTVALTAATGASAFSLPRAIGRVVVSEARMVPSPTAHSLSLTGYQAGQAMQLWEHQLGPVSSSQLVTTAFQSDQIRLARWQTSTGAKTVALTFTTQFTITPGGGGSGSSQQHFLHAINVHDGSEAFSCPLDVKFSTPVQILEVADGSMGLMVDAVDSMGVIACNKCDPPFADSAGTFYHFNLPGISVADEPWVGTWGGANHDHHEDLLITGQNQ